MFCRRGQHELKVTRYHGTPTPALPTTSHLCDIEHHVGVVALLKGVQALTIVPENVTPGSGIRGQGHNETQGVPSGHLCGGSWSLGFKDMGSVGP